MLKLNNLLEVTQVLFNLSYNKFLNHHHNYMQYILIYIKLITQHPDAFQKVILEEGGASQGGGMVPPPPSNVIQITP